MSSKIAAVEDGIIAPVSPSNSRFLSPVWIFLNPNAPDQVIHRLRSGTSPGSFPLEANFSLSHS